MPETVALPENEAAAEEKLGKSAGILRTYDELDFNGEAHERSVLLPPQCQKLEHPAKSAVTYGTCIELFPTEDCQGEQQLRLNENAGYYFSDLTRTQAKGALGSLSSPALSFRACPVIQKTSDEDLVTLYKEREKTGITEIVHVSPFECLDLTTLRDEVSSIDTHGTCIQMYLLEGCEGPSIRVFPGTQFPHTDLNQVLFENSTKPLEDNAQAIRRCTMNHEDLKKSNLGPNSPLPESGVVEIFSEPKNEGVSESIDLADGNCHSLGIKPKSFKTNDNCVIVYQESTCIGSTRRIFPGGEFPQDQLSGVAFIPSHDDVAETAKAIKRCHLP